MVMRALSGLLMSVGVCNDAMFDMQRKLSNASMDTANDKRINEDMEKQIEKKEKERKAIERWEQCIENKNDEQGKGTHATDIVW